MDFFELQDAESKTIDDFISHICKYLSVGKDELRTLFCDACLNDQIESPVYVFVHNIFGYDCFSSDRFRVKKTKMAILTKFAEFLIAGDSGIENMGRKLKEFDYSARCSLVWTTNYFAYRCRTCAISPSMSLCGSCFTAGNHAGHDFNKFKSLAGGACDCGDVNVMLPSGYCRYHGPDKVHNRPSPPEELVAPLRCLLPWFLPALLYWYWELCSSMDQTTVTDEVTPALYILHVLHACGCVTQQMIAGVLIDAEVFKKLKIECAQETAYMDYSHSVSTDPGFNLPPCIADQKLTHHHLLDAFLFCTIKLRFPEPLVTFLIGLLAVEDFKEEFLQSYLNHYTRVAATVMISARTRMITDWSSQMNNRIVHVSVQLFSGESLALRMVKERKMHYLLMHCLLNMCDTCRTRVDDRSNMVVNCDNPLIQNNVFWPFVSDLSNLVSHKSIVDIFMEDPEFLVTWTKVLRYIQFMNCFVLREGDHIEYETMAFYHAFTMEIEMSANTMWNIWRHYRQPAEREHCLAYTNACLSSLAQVLTNLGRLVSPAMQSTHCLRSPLSFHLPLMRHASCFLGLSVNQHGANLHELLSDFILPTPLVLWRFTDELANTLLGLHEVVVGYWIRNGQALRQSVAHYMQSQFCYSFIDLDLFAFQICAALLPPAYVLNTLLDSTRLLRGISFYDELLRLVASPETRNLDRKPMALEAWLLNLCWILDARNNICLTPDELLKKELVCVLSPKARKRSDLALLIPDRCGLNSSYDNLDAVLNKVANYSAPSCDQTSGSLISGLYSLRPGLWHTDFDPIFYALRVISRRENALAMDKYREHCRQRHGVTNTTTLWPPYQTPKPLPPAFTGLDHMLHSRHLHFLIFIQLCLYVYGDPLVTEESLSFIIHLLDRALDTACRDNPTHGKCCQRVQPMQVDSPTTEDELMECTNLPFDDFSDQPWAQVHDSEGSGLVEKPISSFISQLLAANITQNDEGCAAREGIRKRITPRWDASLFKCPYQPRTNLQDNLGCWLMVEHAPTPHVTLAPTVLATLTSNQPNSSFGVIPSVKPSQYDSNQPGLLVDSIISLLIKAHARLHWSRISGSSDAVPKVFAGTALVDPNTLIPREIPRQAPSVSESLINPEQVQVNNALQIHVPSAEISRISSDAPSITRHPSPLSPFALPRCTSVLGNQDCSASLDLSNNMATCENKEEESCLNSDTACMQAQRCDPISLLKLPPELRYFAISPPTYNLQNEKVSPSQSSSVLGSNTENPTNQQCPDFSDPSGEHDILGSGESVLFGDGAFWVERLLHKISRLSSGNEVSIKLYLARARQPFDNSVVHELRLQPMDTFSNSSLPSDNENIQPIKAVCPPSVMTPSRVIDEVVKSESRDIPSPTNVTGPTLGATVTTREERKKAALERRNRLMQQMASKQKAFAMTHLKDMETTGPPSGESQEQMDTSERTYECVICQTSGKASTDDLVLLDMMCESGTNMHIREIPELPILHSHHSLQASGIPGEYSAKQDNSWLIPTRPPDASQSWDDDSSQPHSTSVVPAHSSGQAPTGTVGVSVLATTSDSVNPSSNLLLSAPNAPLLTVSSPIPPSPSPNTFLDTVPALARSPSVGGLGFANNASTNMPPCYVESRRWWSLALPSPISENMPLLRSGVILQSCGHVVHRECFQRYRTQGSNRPGPNRGRGWASCPLCRREVHHLMPLIVISNDVIDRDQLTTPNDWMTSLRTILDKLEPTGKSIWDDLNGAEDELNLQRRTLMSQLIGKRFEATILLRSQLECEMVVLMNCPSQYSLVSRRCSWREFLAYLRHVYRKSADLQSVLNSISMNGPVIYLEDVDTETLSVPLFALCQDPTDIFLTLLPHIWPIEDLFLLLVAMTFTLAYVRALLSALLNSPYSNQGQPWSFPELLSFSSKLSSPMSSHVQFLLALLTTTDFTPSQALSTLMSAARLPEFTLCNEPTSNFSPSEFEFHVISRMLPLLRLAGLARARWHSNSTSEESHILKGSFSHLIPTGLPFVGQTLRKTDGTVSVRESTKLTGEHYEQIKQQRMVEFSDLCRIVNLDCGDTAVISVADVAELAVFRSGLTDAQLENPLSMLQSVMIRWLDQLNPSSYPSIAPDTQTAGGGELDLATDIQIVPMDTVTDVAKIDAPRLWIGKLHSILEVGRQLYPPRLIRTPKSFDALFNALHLVNCDAVQHRYQDNALCLICGRLLCTLCTNLTTVMVEHAYSCEGFSGIVLEVNTSIVYVSLGPTVCEWGSVYLDAYGEEDLELKRGKPLFLNEDRFALLESQWLSHSFRHILKHWRVV